MKDNILNRLIDIGQINNVNILYAVESGSRGWNVASADSDWDVRFIYRRPLKDYTALWPRRDVLEVMDKEANIDMVGWDVIKTLRLAASNNLSIIEWLHAKDPYLEQTFRWPESSETICRWNEELRDIMKDFSERHLAHHYLSLLSRQYKAYFLPEDAQVRLKKYVYALRPALCVHWLLDHAGERRVPPLDFRKLLAECKVELSRLYTRAWWSDFEGEILHWLDEKAMRTEKESYGRYPAMDKFISGYVGKPMHEIVSKLLPTSVPDRKKLEQFFRDTIYREFVSGIGSVFMTETSEDNLLVEKKEGTR